jgi:hypothetical protein
MPRYLFREKPPEDLVLRILSTARLHGMDDTSWFLSSSIDISALSTLLPELQPYYLPSRDKYTTRPLTPSTAITIFRQLLREHSRNLIGKERQRKTWYSITPLLNPEIHLSFQ